MAPPRPRFRIGIDTGDTFTDVVAVNEATREVLATKTPSTPGRSLARRARGAAQGAAVDDEPLPAGTLVRIETTGGGGWGDPLEREPQLVALDVRQGKVREGSARDDYGVVLVREGDDVRADLAATVARRVRLAAERGPAPSFDRGPGYARLAGKDHADVDFVEAPAR